MPLSPGAADGSCDDRSANALRGDVHGQLVQARDIHGGVTIHASQAPPPPPPLVDVSLDAPRPATAVRGREELLAALGSAMRAGAPVPHVLTGPGGFGKTTVAAALAERARADGWTVFWVRPGDVAAGMVEAAVEAGGPRREAEQVRATRHRAVRWAWRHLDAAPRPWLLVIDNADRPAELDPENRPGDQLGWMRSSPGGFVLVTSRVDDPLLWSPARVHRVGELDAPAAAAALADHAGLAELAGAEELAVRLGGVPLALSLAGRILATHGVLFPDAHALLDGLREDVGALDELAAPFVPVADADRGLLSGVWELSLRLVAEREPKAAPLLRILAVLGSGTVPVPLRRLPLSELAVGALGPLGEASFARAVNALVVHGLVTVERREAEAFLRLHPLVAETVRAGLTDADLPLVELAERLLDHQRHRDLRFELQALVAIVSLRVRMHPADEDAATARVGDLSVSLTALPPATLQTVVSAGGTLLRLGRPEDAEAALAPVVAAAEEQFGRAHPTALSGRHLLAEARLHQGRVDEAERSFRELHADRAGTLGPEHPDTLDTAYQLGLIAIRRERWDEAGEILSEVREACLRTAGEEDPLHLFAAQNLAYVTMRLGDPAAAETGFRRVHRVRERVLGAGHHLTADAAFYVGRAAQERGECAEALRIFTDVLRNWEEQLGEEHPQVETVKRRIAEVAEPGPGTTR
ncbi:tetratricopeptide repeat protein [Nocardiopsis sp. NPDC006198]|uniref:tetratricopeptide repeat protein n=1 Tax=Nocardiopsis sp. NPDC006198 TaxID=3154472 RepID=UPI0033BBACBF